MSSGNVFYDMNAIFLNFLIFDSWSVFNAVFSMQTGKLLTKLFFRTKKMSFRCLFQEIEGKIIKNGVQSQKISQQFPLVPKRWSRKYYEIALKSLKMQLRISIKIYLLFVTTIKNSKNTCKRFARKFRRGWQIAFLKKIVYTFFKAVLLLFDIS